MNLTELAQRAKVAKSTASMALRDDPKISPATRERIIKLAKKYAYHVDPTLAEVMSAISKRNHAPITAPLALLTNWSKPSPWKLPGASLRRNYNGLVDRARTLGFRVEEFWLRERGMTGRRMVQILQTRGIKGVIVFNYETAPEMIDIDLSSFVSASFGRALIKPHINSVDQNHQQGIFLALEKVAALGYNRPGLVLTAGAHERTMHSWAAGFQFLSLMLPKKDRVPLLLVEDFDYRALLRWYKRYSPDVILANGQAVHALCLRSGVKIPEQVGYVTLYWQTAKDHLAGIDLRDEAITARVVELVVEQIRQNRYGLPLDPETVLLDGVWRNGPSLIPMIGRKSTNVDQNALQQR